MKKLLLIVLVAISLGAYGQKKGRAITPQKISVGRIDTLYFENDTLYLTEDGILFKTEIISGTSVSLGATTKIPYMNAGGTDFIYSSNLLFDGTALTSAAMNISAENPLLQFLDDSGDDFDLGTVNNNTLSLSENTTGDLVQFFGTGALEFSQYGSGTFTGTAAKWLAVDASGNLIEEAAPTGGSTDYINGSSFTTSTGVLSLTGVGSAGTSQDLDGRYGILTGNNTWEGIARFNSTVNIYGGSTFGGSVFGNSLGLTFTSGSGKRVQLNADARNIIIQSDGFYPDLDAATTSDVAYYNSSTKELTYGAAPSGTSLWALTSTTLRPNSDTYEVLIGGITDQGNYKLQVADNSYFETEAVVGGQLTLEQAGSRVFFEDATRHSWWMQLAGADSKDGFSILGGDADQSIFTLADDGSAYFEEYGSGTYTGTAAYNIEVNSAGMLIETTTGSDYRMKKNFRTLHNSLNKILSLNTYAFDWIPKEELPKKAEDIPFDIKVDNDWKQRAGTGVIAQEIQNIIPEAVKQYNNGYYKVDYEVIIPHLIEAIKEQQKQIDELKSKIKN